MVLLQRYRLMPLNFDASHHGLEPSDAGWDAEIRAAHDAHREKLIERLARIYGSANIDQVVANSIAFGADPWIMIGWHIEMWREVRHSFVSGAYYPAAVSAGTLAERVLNHLVTDLQDRCATQDDLRTLAGPKTPTFGAALRILERWKVLEDEAIVQFRRLQRLRNKLVHFDPSLYGSVRLHSLEAVRTLRDALDRQFGVFVQRRLIQETPGLAFLRKTVEKEPFVETYLLPAALRVGPAHEIGFDSTTGRWQLVDDQRVEVPTELDTDAEFVRRLSTG